MTTTPPRRSGRTIAIPIVEGVQLLDVAGPHEVFCGANLALDHLERSDPRYDVVVAGPRVGPVPTESGLPLEVAVTHDDLRRRRDIDTVLVPGGDGPRGASADSSLVTATRTIGRRARRVASVCTGTFVLARAGLLDGRRVTTHWAHAGELGGERPDLAVDPDPIYLQDGPIWTSAGVTAGIDLALAMVEDDVGPAVAQLVARHLVVPLRRPGGQSQFATPVWCDPGESAPIRRACELIHADPADDHRLDRLAPRVGLSARHLGRRFRHEVGETPARYVERVRVDAARALLENETVGLDVVADRCGFASAEVLRRAFHRRLGLSPADYRRRHRHRTESSFPTTAHPTRS